MRSRNPLWRVRRGLRRGRRGLGGGRGQARQLVIRLGGHVLAIDVERDRAAIPGLKQLLAVRRVVGRRGADADESFFRRARHLVGRGDRRRVRIGDHEAVAAGVFEPDRQANPLCVGVDLGLRPGTGLPTGEQRNRHRACNPPDKITLKATSPHGPTPLTAGSVHK